MTPGIITLGETDYHADPADSPSLSNSLIKELLICPRRAWIKHPRLNPQYKSEESDAFDFGKAQHARFLEGRDIVTVVDAADWRTKKAQEERETVRAMGRIPLLPKDAQKLDSMVGAAVSFIESCGLAMAFEFGHAEQSLIWRESNDAWCRARPDWLTTDNKVIIDFKTTSAASPDKFFRSFIEYGYDTQAAFYTRGMRNLGHENVRFYFLVQETTAPFLCYLVEPAESMKQLAGIKVERAVNLWAQCIKADKWPGYPVQSHMVEAPAWAMYDAGMEKE